MSLAVLRPNGTVSNSGTIVGAASAHAALSDNSDASYINFTAGQSAEVNLSDFVLPSGAVIKHVSVRARLDGSPASYAAEVIVRISDAMTVGGTVSPTSMPTTITIGSAVVGWTAAQINGATLVVTNVGDGDIGAYEAYFDVTYVEKPVATVTAPTGTVTNTNRPVIEWTMT